MDIDKKEYKKYVEARAPKSPLAKDCVRAFWVGGLICTIGQAFMYLYGEVFSMNKTDSGTLTSVTLILIAVLLTGIGVFDNIAKYAGAGTIVPITGFANSIVSSAMEFKSEGYVMGLGAKMFTIAGPVIVFGVITSIVCGIVYFIISGGLV